MANTQPNLYEVSGHGIHVTYSTTSITEKPLFNYHDTFQTKNFSGDEIQTQSSMLGTLVSVFLLRTIDGPSTSFTLLVPSVRLPASEVATISTEGITALHKFSIVGPPVGQTELYTVHPLHGTARFVVF
ncbi:hypothetical protein ACFFWD_13905 [Bradyrhizobium erythrophlei]|uniref:hypothetical protein n=1 Tax=Bradyrhizobium erythrophlei TaxID=1437360 RepID=UPI0035EAAE57